MLKRIAIFMLLFASLLTLASEDILTGSWIYHEKEVPLHGKAAAAVLLKENRVPNLGVTCIGTELSLALFLEKMDIGRKMKVRYRVDDGPVYEERWLTKRALGQNGLLAANPRTIAERLLNGKTLKVEVRDARWSKLYKSYSLEGAGSAISKVIAACS